MLAQQANNNFFARALGVLFSLLLLVGFAMLPLLMALREKNQELNLLATTDTLTGLVNRRSCLEQADAFSALASRKRSVISVAVLDLDHFKMINDTYGHPAGDEVLRVVAAAIDKLRRKSDIAARMGGEEFAIVMYDTDLSGAAVFCEKLRQSLEVMNPIVDSRPIRITASIGLAAGYGAEADFRRLYSRADQALYVAKSRGRNRLVVEDEVLVA